ncbi:MAG: hypothetical protein K2J78_11590, partial [Muribaculaceae bacterium]|nr:hypothetical protein [Muribaculaceae bacterium]
NVSLTSQIYEFMDNNANQILISQLLLQTIQWLDRSYYNEVAELITHLDPDEVLVSLCEAYAKTHHTGRYRKYGQQLSYILELPATWITNNNNS